MLKAYPNPAIQTIFISCLSTNLYRPLFAPYDSSPLRGLALLLPSPLEGEGEGDNNQSLFSPLDGTL